MSIGKQLFRLFIGFLGIVGGIVLFFYAMMTQQKLLQLLDVIFFCWLSFTVGIGAFFSVQGYKITWQFFGTMLAFTASLALLFMSVLGVVGVANAPEGDFWAVHWSYQLIFFAIIPATVLLINSMYWLFSTKIKDSNRKIVLTLSFIIGILVQVILGATVGLISTWITWLISIGLLNYLFYLTLVLIRGK